MVMGSSREGGLVQVAGGVNFFDARQASAWRALSFSGAQT